MRERETEREYVRGCVSVTEREGEERGKGNTEMEGDDARDKGKKDRN